MHVKRNIIRVIAVLTAISALYVLFPDHWKYWFRLLQSLQSGQSPLEGVPVWYIPMSILFDLILIGKLVAAIGLFRLRKWGRQIAIVVLSADFIIRLSGAINAWTWHLRHPESPPVFDGEVTVLTVSMIPSYIIAIVSLICVVVLSQRIIKSTFKEKTA